ncbi:MAG: DUF835 domain-containing protein [Methanophagales archaeon]|nr:DUF835 domain-containing protein [Methanophagales archaeon]
MLVDIAGIALFASLAFTIYYLREIIKFLKGGKGWKLITAGYILYVPRVALSLFMDYPQSPIEIARISLSVAIVILIALGMWKLMKDLRSVGISFFSLAYVRYLTAGMFLFLACLSIRTSSFFFLRLNEPLWWTIARIFLVASILMLGFALRKIYVVLGPKTKEIKTLMRAVEMKWMRENLHIIPLYTQLTNEIIAHLIPLEGGMEVAKRVLERCAASHEILRGCEISEEGLNTAVIFRDVENMSEKESYRKMFYAFSCLNSMLIDAYAAITSPERAMEVVKDGEEIIEHMRKVNLPVNNELIYRYRIFFGMPEGIAENGKSKTLLYILFKEALEPLLMKCTKSAIKEISAVARAKGIEIESDGRVNLEAIFRRVHEIIPEESVEYTKSILSAVMTDIYPLIREDIGAEQTKKRFSAVFKELIENHCGAILKYGILENLPEDVEIPRWCSLLRRGQCYLICEEKPIASLKLFNMLAQYGFKGLLISRMHPSHVHAEYKMRADVPLIWLTHIRGENHIAPTNITQLSIAVKDFVERGVEGIIMIEGFEYLIDQNGFDVALRFLESIVDIVTVSKCRLIMPFDKLTVSEREFHRIAREMNVMSRDGVEEITAATEGHALSLI